MVSKHNLYELPDGLPPPIDDGASDHLPGAGLPSVPLRSTAGTIVDLSALSGRTVVYCYPLTGPPDRDLPQGWDEIPGARGCTPQSCAFRDRHAELRDLGARLFGLSTQDTEYQREAAERLHLPFELLSDESLAFAKALSLPIMPRDFISMTGMPSHEGVNALSLSVSSRLGPIGDSWCIGSNDDD